MATPCWTTNAKERFRIRKNVFFSRIATIVTLTRLNVMLSAHCLSCIKKPAYLKRYISWFLRIVSSGVQQTGCSTERMNI